MVALASRYPLHGHDHRHLQHREWGASGTGRVQSLHRGMEYYHQMILNRDLKFWSALFSFVSLRGNSHGGGRLATLGDIASSGQPTLPGGGGMGRGDDDDDDDDDGDDRVEGESWFAGGERRWVYRRNVFIGCCRRLCEV